VFAGPTAYGLYGRCGFKTAGTVVTTVTGEEEALEFPGMVREPKDSEYFHEEQPRRISIAYVPVTES
jgi:hypothetical protein